jgi:hypothetical protein
MPTQSRMINAGPSGFQITLLVGGIVLALVLTVAFAPIAKCPDCLEWARLHGDWKLDNHVCGECQGKGVVSIAKKWMLLRNAPAR